MLEVHTPEPLGEEQGVCLVPGRMGECNSYINITITILVINKHISLSLYIYIYVYIYIYIYICLYGVERAQDKQTRLCSYAAGFQAPGSCLLCSNPATNLTGSRRMTKLGCLGQAMPCDVENCTLAIVRKCDCKAAPCHQCSNLCNVTCHRFEPFQNLLPWLPKSLTGSPRPRCAAADSPGCPETFRAH